MQRTALPMLAFVAFLLAVHQVRAQTPLPVPANSQDVCKTKHATPLLFHLLPSGTVDHTVAKTEGPACVEVMINPLRFTATLSSATTVAAGPDLSGLSTPSANKGLVGADTAQLARTVGVIRAFLAFADGTISASKNQAYAAALIVNNYTTAKLPNGSTLQNELDLAYQAAAAVPASTSDPDLQKLVPIIQFWSSRFQSTGLTLAGATDVATLESLIAQRQETPCGNLFNNTSSTSFGLALSDVSPLLDDPKAAAKISQVSNFAVIACSTPFALSAGAEFSLIRNQQFGIIQAPGGPNNTSLKVYGLTTDSPVHTLPLAVASVRLIESSNKVVAGHASFGISGNIQSASSGGSTVEFLPGLSASFFRTMFITVGPHIGYESVLSGGVRVGDPVATDVSSPQVTKRMTVNLGVAITFTKP